MKITKVFYSALSNLGNYQNERVGMYAVLDEGESPEEAIKQLKERVTPLCGSDLRKLRDEEWQLRGAIGDLEKKLKEYQQQWDIAAEFLRVQGIKPDAPNFPQLTKLLSPSVSHEVSEVVEAEYDEEEYDGEDEE